MLRSLESQSARSLKAMADSCVQGTSLDSSLFALATAQIQTPWYPTPKRHANPEVGV